MAEEVGIGIPSRLILTIRASLDMKAMPPEIIKKAFGKDNVADLKQWAAEFKEEMESDPEFGPYVTVNVDVEEVI